MGLVVPGARGVSEFWDVVGEGQPVFSEPGTRWPLAGYYDADPAVPDRCSAAKLGFIHPATDAPPRTDHVEEWLRQALGEALRSVSRRDQDRYSLLVGCTAESSQHLLESLVMAEAADWGNELVKLVGQHLAFADPHPVSHLPYASAWRAREGLLPETTDLLMVDSACSSSLYALDLGMRRLAEGSCDIAICAGAHVLTWRDMMLFSGLGALSAQGDVRPFDRAGDGVLFSDAAAVVVLKPLARAKADGDPVLGVIGGIGLSCDGRGQAIHAPRESGQRLAIDRALAAADVTVSDIDLMLAHGTGTPLGDKTELAGLRALFADTPGVPVVSVKSVVGHGGWCAGLVSVIHALSTLQRQVIPPQHRYTEPSSALGADGILHVPQQPLPFPPRADRPRTIGLSAFGFGGTNAHLIITDRPPRPADPVPPRTTEQMVLVAWSAQLPGTPDAAAVESWLSTGHAAPPLAFTDDEAAAWVGEIRLPPASAAVLDHTQLLALHTVRSLRNDLGDIWDRHRTDIGVLAGHSGISRTSFGYTLRCALGLLGLDADESDEFAAFADRVRAGVPPAGEDAYCSQLPSLISGRIANELDIQGLNMTIDTGAGSMLAAITAARTLLRTGALRLAVVCGVDAKAFPRWRAVAMDALYDGLEPAEGAVAFALTSRDFAESEGLPILAVLGGDDGHEQAIPVHDLVPGGRNYLAAQLGFAVLNACKVGHPVTISVRDAQTGRQDRLRVTPITTPPAVSEYTQPRRCAIRLVEATNGRAQEPVAAIPDRCLIVTNLPAFLVGWGEPGNRVVLTLPPDGKVTDETVSEAVARTGVAARHVRLIAEIGMEREGELERLLALHDLTLLAVRAVLGGTEDRRSFAALLLDGVRNSTPRPALGMFTGFIRSLAMENPRDSVHAVVTADRDVSEGLRLLAAESAIRSPLRITFHEKGHRRIEQVVSADPMTPLPQPPLTDSAVVVAAGGARGITAPILTALARRYAPTFWLLGSTDLDAFPRWVFRGDDAWFDSLRPSFIRRRLNAGATATPSELSVEFDRMRAARSARATLTALTDACGTGRVHYRTCDVTDQAAVDRTMSEILAKESSIDLLIFAAGVSSPARIADRTLADFRATRDVKIRGYLHLRHALAAQPPRLWCNFGSVLGFTGEDGDSGYAAGNGYLATSASAHERSGEWTIGWNWWSQDGLLARPVVRESMIRRWGDQGMPTSAGIASFNEELCHAHREPFILYLSPAHITAIEARLPGFADSTRRAPDATASSQQPPQRSREAPRETLLSRIVSAGQGRYVAEVDFDDARLATAHHLVDGRPCLAGMFAVELAAEAAAVLVPDRALVAVEQLRFHRFIRPITDGGGVIVVRAELDSTEDSAEQRLHVRLLTDVVTDEGSRLATRVTAAELIAVLTAFRPEPPTTRRVPPAGEPRQDPFCAPNPWVHLNGPFRCVAALATGPDGAAAEFTPDPPLGALWRSRLTPVLMLDAAVRVGALSGRQDLDPRLAVFSSADRIDLHVGGNDLTLAATPGPITASAWPTAAGTTCSVASPTRALVTVTGLITLPWPRHTQPSANG